MKDFLIVNIEALIVGVCLVFFYYIVNKIFPGKNVYTKIFISGMIFHLIFEYTG